MFVTCLPPVTDAIPQLVLMEEGEDNKPLRRSHFDGLYCNVKLANKLISLEVKINKVQVTI